MVAFEPNIPQLIAGNDSDLHALFSAFKIESLTAFERRPSSALSVPHRGPNIKK